MNFRVALGKDIVLARLETGSVIVPGSSPIRRTDCVDPGPKIGVGRDEVIRCDSSNGTVFLANIAVVSRSLAAEDDFGMPQRREARSYGTSEMSQAKVTSYPANSEKCDSYKSDCIQPQRGIVWR